MTKTKINYSNGVIYKIVCNDLDCKDLYVGSTTNFTNRKNLHKSACTNENSKRYNLKVYKSIRANGGWNNWSMVLIEHYPCKDGNELRAKERLWYEQLNGTLNSCIPNRSQKEQIKEYYKNNKEKINDEKKQKINCMCGSTFRKSDKARHERSQKHLNYVNSQLDQLNGSI